MGKRTKQQYSRNIVGLLEYSRKVLNDMKGIFRYGNVLTKLLSSLNLTSAAHWKDEHEWHIFWKRQGGERRSYFPTTFPLKLRDSDPVSDQGLTDVLNP